MNRLRKMFEPDLVAAVEKYREDQLDNPDLEEAKTRKLIDWLIAHRYLPLGDTQKMKPAANDALTIHLVITFYPGDGFQTVHPKGGYWVFILPFEMIFE